MKERQDRGFGGAPEGVNHTTCALQAQAAERRSPDIDEHLGDCDGGQKIRVLRRRKAEGGQLKVVDLLLEHGEREGCGTDELKLFDQREV